MVKYGYCFWYEDGEISSIPSKVRELGLDFAEASLTYPWPDLIPQSEILTTKDWLMDLGVEFAFHGPLEGLFLFNPRKELVRAAGKIHRKCMEFSAKFDPLYYTFHVKADFMTLHIKAKDIALQNCLNKLDGLIKLAHDLGIRLVVENSSSTGYLVPLEELLNRELDFNLDVGHWFKCGRGYDELNSLLEKLGKRIVLLHLHDTRFQEDPIEDHLALDRGDIDFERVFNILRNSGIKWIDLETLPSTPSIVPENLSKAKKLVEIMLK